ncbi:hypothetical protein A1O1_04012 [Capronia coronata CBS 617.96]|uniref:Uncharacterized protein n=1 Tax=Capronia coronata CBS 617.96 TaxID=1182541 RepID=W9YNW1_9EURO|nr:uncharacterized protein A1O1_04012 [Capronia coronata CBS 617.96]EXJ90906.1 hypothetical protein A1O1_04012 [Capronia coronata CBS 617.96]
MTQSRQQAFQRLRPACVELSSTVLRFKASQASPKAVLLALEPVHDVLQSLGSENLLDEKLAEYAFFPLTHIFNQARSLPSHVLEVAVRCVEILVSRGWRDKIVPEMARQLLILMSLLVSPNSNPSQPAEPATDELICASCECIRAIIAQIARASTKVLDEVGDTNIVDRLVYQLLQIIADSSSEIVQISAAQALLELYSAIASWTLAASLLPRTVSTLVKVLRPSTQARRTRKVLVAYLKLFNLVVRKTLSDEVVEKHVEDGGTELATNQHAQAIPVLNKSWLQATATQIDLALVQVTKLRTYKASDVAGALLDLCLLVIEECPQTLALSVPLMVETMVVLCRSPDSSRADAMLRHIVTSRPEIADILIEKFYDWTQALPRVMQGHNDRPKQQMLGQVATSFAALAESWNATDELSSRIAATLVDSAAAAIGSTSKKARLIDDVPHSGPIDLADGSTKVEGDFKPIILSHQSQQSSTNELMKFVSYLKSQPSSRAIVRSIINQTLNPDVDRRLAATWLGLAFLGSSQYDISDIDDLIESNASETESQLSRPFLISDLYALTLPNLLQYPEAKTAGDAEWRLVAMSLESLTLQARQLGRSYRPELVETLFPLLTLFGDENAMLQRHAVTALNIVANACEYESAAQMLVDNVDYLVNAVALRLNTFDVSRDSLQVLAMMIRLCGARLLPHLDDLIASIFGALDSFHGYPSLVEQLFAILKMMVEQSSKTPEVLAIGSEHEHEPDTVVPSRVSGVEDIVNDLRARLQRRLKSDEEHEAVTRAPHRPWMRALDGPDDDGQGKSSDDEVMEDVQDQLEDTSRAKEPTLSKAHQLLLNIAQSAVPHMSSPSPKVRLTLLQLLDEVCPLLAQDENSFLPFVNAVWPAIVPRLLAKEEDASSDMPYTMQAAADTISTLCRAAGHFMASRIEDVFSDVEALFKKLSSAIKPTGRSQQRPASSKPKVLGTDIVTSYDRRAIRPNQTTGSNGLLTMNQNSSAIRTSNERILDSLVDMFLSILRHVRMSEDNVDRLFDMLAPLMYMPGKGDVKAALTEYNEDAVWLMEQQMNT